MHDTIAVASRGTLFNAEARHGIRILSEAKPPLLPVWFAPKPRTNVGCRGRVWAAALASFGGTKAAAAAAREVCLAFDRVRAHVNPVAGTLANGIKLRLDTRSVL